MARKAAYDDYRVEVYPDFGGYSRNLSHIDRLRVCEELAKQIKRHVDDIDGTRCTSDDASVCEFCGSLWTEGRNDPHNGGCCDADAANMPEETEKGKA